MSINEICWDIFSKDALPEALFGESGANHYGRLNFSRPRLGSGQVALGFKEDQRDKKYSPPSIILVNENAYPEIFSWLKVYVPETSPLTQFARVITDADWDRFQPRSSNVSMTTRSDRWACLVLGEVLAQGEGDMDLATIPLSRSSACFTTAVARTAIIHDHDEATRTAVERLRLLETDRRFVRRLVTVDDLLPAWGLIGANINGATSASEIAELVLDTIWNHARTNEIENSRLPRLNDFPGLTSDSVEERVLAFQRIANEMTRFAQHVPHNLLMNVTLAAAAFLVGRSTTHAFLLRRWSKTFPLAFAWFGVMAALAGARQWDPIWSRAVKGIEKTLRTTFNWTDPPAADLCWCEFTWLAGSFEGPDVFGDMPKTLPRVLAVEVVPGAACQLRLESAVGRGIDGDLRPQTEPSQREQELQATLAQFIEMATKARHLLEPKSVASHGTQQSLILDEFSSPKKASRGKQRK